MGLICWYSFVKVKAFFSWKNNKSGIIFSVLSFAGILYITGMLYLLMGELSNRLPVERIKDFLLGAIILMTVIRKFIPQYVPFRKLLLPYHPKAAFFRYAFNIWDEICCFNFLNAVIFIFLLLLFPFFKFRDAFIWVIWLGVAVLIRRFIQCLLEQRIQRYFSFLLLCLFLGILVVSAVVWPTLLLKGKVWQTALMALLFMGIADFLMEEVIGEYEFTNRRGITSSNIGINILLNAPVLRVAVTGALIVKSLFLLILTMRMQRKGGNDMLFITMLFSSPALPFTYCFNNCWGPLRNYWFSVDKANPNGWMIWRLQLRIMALPLAVDTALTLLFYIANNILGPMVLVSYFASGFLLCVLAFYWSFLFPFYVKRGFSMNVNTSTVASIATIPICTALCLVSLSPVYYLIAVAYIIAAVLLMIRMNKFYNSTRITLYSKMYN